MTTTTGSRPAALTSDAIDWRASTDEHPARMASMRSYSAVAKGDLEEWLTVKVSGGATSLPQGEVVGVAPVAGKGLLFNALGHRL